MYFQVHVLLKPYKESDLFSFFGFNVNLLILLCSNWATASIIKTQNFYRFLKEFFVFLCFCFYLVIFVRKFWSLQWGLWEREIRERERERGWGKQRKMKNSVSDHSFYIESDEEEVEVEKEFDKAEENNDGNASDSSDSSADHQQQIKPGSYNTSWPQSYRFLLSLSLSFSVPLCLVSWISFICLFFYFPFFFFFFFDKAYWFSLMG